MYSQFSSFSKFIAISTLSPHVLLSVYCNGDNGNDDDKDDKVKCEDLPGELVANDALEDGPKDGVAMGGLQEPSQV